MGDFSSDAPTLELKSVMGFAGGVSNGLLIHPNQRHIVYPLGSTIVVKDLVDDTQVFLQGHNNEVSCLTLSPDGTRLVSGQKTHMGFKAEIIVWDFASQTVMHRLALHAGLIQDVAFSPCGTYIASLGGPDDNKLVVWEVESGIPVRGESAGTNTALTVRWFSNSSTQLVTAGKYTLRIWDFVHTTPGAAGGRLAHEEVVLGQIKRVIPVIAISDDDVFCYCGTGSGDVLRVSLVAARFSIACRRRFECGVTSIACFRGPGGATNLFVGSGNGDVGHIRDFDIIPEGAVPPRGTARDPFMQTTFATTRAVGAKLKAGGKKKTARAKAQRGLVHHETKHLLDSARITSLALGDGFGFIGTSRGQYYKLGDFAATGLASTELQCTAHFSAVNDVVFPRNCSEIFVTCSFNDIRVWSAKSRAELLRIQVPNLTCTCLAVSPDGSAIISGWDDGKIRVFLPQSGKLVRVINNAHSGAVTAVACTNLSRDLISGGADGRLRVWRAGRMLCSLKEHKAAISAIQVRPDDLEMVSASEDGSCIVWDLVNHVRCNAFFATTKFRSIRYHPDESQFITCGSDRKITYWDAVSCQAIRELDGSNADIFAIAVDEDGTRFVSAGDDMLVR
jgi:WD40 repeat protein